MARLGDLQMRITRRSFVKFTALSALSNFVLPNAFGARRRGEEEKTVWVPKVGRYANTVCNGCINGCGMRVKRIEKNAVKLEGNPDYPLNKGTLCAEGQAALQSLYNPDRIKTPLKRTGKRGSGKWEVLDWDSAINEVAGRLQKLRSEGRPHELSLLSGRLGEGTPFLFDRFMKSFGSPNLIWCPSLSDESALLSEYLMDGNEGGKAYDFTKTQYVVSFGDSLQNPSSRMHFLNNFKQMRFERPGRRVKLLAVDCRLSTTASKADEWVPVNPGTEGAFALGIAHVLIKENLYNSDFINSQTFGFEDCEDKWGVKHQGFKSLVLQEYSPEQVSGITGVPSATIVRVTKEIANNSPAMVLCSHNSYFSSNGVYNGMACYCLNALIGSINTAGGIGGQRKPPVTEFPMPAADKTAAQGLAMPRIDGAGSAKSPLAFHAAGNIPKALLNDGPYSLDTLMVYNCNPLFTRVDSEAYKKAFNKIPFIVNFSTFMDETALYSDIILPEPTFLERWETTSIHSSLGRAVFGVRQPVVKPLYDTLNTGDAIIRIGNKIGKPVSNAFPWKDSQEFVKERVRGVQESSRGSVVAAYSKKFWKKLLEKGGWWETEYIPDRSRFEFNTPSGKFEFLSQIMLKGLKKSEEGKQTATDRADKKFLPHFENPRFRGRNMKFSSILVPFTTPALGVGNSANKPYLQEIFGGVHALTGETWVEINPEMAKLLNIADRSYVWIESPMGKIKAVAVIFPGTLPNVVNIPIGQGHTAFGRFAEGRGRSILSLIEKDFDAISSAQVLTGTRVNIYKA
jgi:anaerobic selenocysteine-containing dehydrogenase